MAGRRQQSPAESPDTRAAAMGGPELVHVYVRSVRRAAASLARDSGFQTRARFASAIFARLSGVWGCPPLALAAALIRARCSAVRFLPLSFAFAHSGSGALRPSPPFVVLVRRAPVSRYRSMQAVSAPCQAVSGAVQSRLMVGTFPSRVRDRIQNVWCDRTRSFLASLMCWMSRALRERLVFPMYRTSPVSGSQRA